MWGIPQKSWSDQAATSLKAEENRTLAIPGEFKNLEEKLGSKQANRQKDKHNCFVKPNSILL